MAKRLNWGKSDPVDTDSAKTADLAKGRPEKMLFWHATTVFLMRHHTCWNQLEIQTILIVIFRSDNCVSMNGRKCATAQVVFLPHVLRLQGISMCGHIGTPAETPKEFHYIWVQLHVEEMRHARQQKLQDLSQPGALLPSFSLSPASLRRWLPCVHVCACEGRLCACQHVCMSSYKSCSQQTTEEKM